MDKHRALLRAVNDRIREVNADLASEDGDFLCECGVENCAEIVRLTIREYDAFRARPEDPALVAPAHRVVA